MSVVKSLNFMIDFKKEHSDANLLRALSVPVKDIYSKMFTLNS